VAITGHTDRLGSIKGNQRLSLQRAESVKAYLVSQRVPAERLTTNGAGATQPVVQCKQKQRKALVACLRPNRRVTVEPITVNKN
jgi:OmpA-OmpF porin, OOP family